jgi:hypothetical protein
MRINEKLAGLALTIVAQQSGAAVISSFDQYTLELLNQMRANPQSSANSYLSGNLNEGLPAGTISSSAKQPLAWDLNLVTAAQGHTSDMISNNFFNHTGSDGRNPFQRMNDAGYIYQSAGENLSTRGDSALTGITADLTRQMNIDLFVDSGVPNRGHRTSMLNNNFESVGISVGFSSSYSPLGGLPGGIVTVDFGANSNGAFLTGVAFDDQDSDNFYSPGEGLGGLTVTAYDAGTNNIVASTTTLEAGGYTLDLGNGLYDIEITGDLGRVFEPGIVLGDENIKIDYNNYNVVSAVPVPAAIWLFASSLIGFGAFSKRRT